jgi:7,8-dihydropterin-6-yl-methyl-4-(beta-D-ribofuranosyl)aminobenzene 5'-phosphate synthase
LRDDQSASTITILVDNNAVPGMGLMAEHGFSALIERPNARILFDTGQGPALAHNSQVLGIDLTGLDLVVLSHGHYDHTGGLERVVALNPGINVVAHPKALSSHLVKRDTDTVPREIGIPHEPGRLTAGGARFNLLASFSEILDGVWFTGQVPRSVSNEQDTRLLVKGTTGFRQDLIEDDASLLLHTPAGPVLLLGCAHAGVRNILEYVSSQTGLEQLHAVIGGTHLAFCPEHETDAVIEQFDRYGVQCIATAHCTGLGPNKRLRRHFGDRFHDAWAGTVFRF